MESILIEETLKNINAHLKENYKLKSLDIKFGPKNYRRKYSRPNAEIQCHFCKPKKWLTVNYSSCKIGEHKFVSHLKSQHPDKLLNDSDEEAANESEIDESGEEEAANIPDENEKKDEVSDSTIYYNVKILCEAKIN